MLTQLEAKEFAAEWIHTREGRSIRLITRLKRIPQGPSLMATIEETMKQLISSGSTFERDIAYSRAVVDGEWVFVSGTTGFNYREMTIPDDRRGTRGAMPDQHRPSSNRGGQQNV